MQFVGLEPFREIDVEVRTADGVYDLHNSAILRSLCVTPEAREVEASWTITNDGLKTGPGRLVFLVFRGCRSVTIDGDFFDSSENDEPMGLDGISYVPDQNGPDWIQLIFENDARLTIRCDHCVARVELEHTP